MSSKIFTICHKPVDYGIPESDLYQPLQVGFGERFASMTDHDQQPNWAAWNPIMAENTGNLYIAKYEAEKYDYVGVQQYRRHLGYGFETAEEVEKLFNEFDILASYPLRMPVSVDEQYRRCHSKIDMDIIADILPEGRQRDAWAETRKENVLFYSNGFVMQARDYIEYYDWLNSVFVGYLRARGLVSPESAIEAFRSDIKRQQRKKTRGIKYQCQVLGFLGERLFTMWLRENYEGDRIALAPYKLMEEGMEI